MLFGVGYRGDLAAALKRGDVREQDRRYVWIAEPKAEPTHTTEPRVSSNLPALLPPVPHPDPARLNKDELRIERARIEDIFLDKIKVRGRRRALNQAKVNAIADSMDRIGLQTPITVYKTDNGEFELGVGLHPHAAAKSLGWSKIPCRLRKTMAFHVPPQSGRSDAAVPTARATSNTDRRVDPILHSVAQLGNPGRPALWETLADRWPDEMKAAIASRLRLSSAGSELLN
jgi:hypothetical protein